MSCLESFITDTLSGHNCISDGIGSWTEVRITVENMMHALRNYETLTPSLWTIRKAEPPSWSPRKMTGVSPSAFPNFASVRAPCLKQHTRRESRRILPIKLFQE